MILKYRLTKKQQKNYNNKFLYEMNFWTVSDVCLVLENIKEKKMKVISMTSLLKYVFLFIYIGVGFYNVIIFESQKTNNSKQKNIEKNLFSLNDLISKVV